MDEALIHGALTEINRALATTKANYSALDERIDTVQAESANRTAASTRDIEAKLSRLETRFDGQRTTIERQGKTIERLENELLALKHSTRLDDARPTARTVKQEEEDLDVPPLKRPNGILKVNGERHGTLHEAPSKPKNGSLLPPPAPSAPQAYHPYERTSPAPSQSPFGRQSSALPILQPSMSLSRAEPGDSSSDSTPRIPSELKGKGKAIDPDRPREAVSPAMDRKKSLKPDEGGRSGHLRVNGTDKSRNGVRVSCPGTEGTYRDEQEKASLFASLHGSHVHSPSPSYPLTSGSRYAQNETSSSSKNLSTIDIAGLEEFASHLDTPAYFSTFTSPPLDSPEKLASKAGSSPGSSKTVTNKDAQIEGQASPISDRLSLSSIVTGAGAGIHEAGVRDRERRVRQREESIIAREKETSALEESIAERLRIVKAKEDALRAEAQRAEAESERLRAEKEEFAKEKERFVKARKATEAEHADKDLELERRLALLQKKERHSRAAEEAKKAKPTAHANGNGRERSDSAESGGARIDRRPHNEQEAREFRRRQDWETKKREMRERETSLAKAEEVFRQKSGDWKFGL